jgi:hypothetical protein
MADPTIMTKSVIISAGLDSRKNTTASAPDDVAYMLGPVTSSDQSPGKVPAAKRPAVGVEHGGHEMLDPSRRFAVRALSFRGVLPMAARRRRRGEEDG